MSCQRRKGQRGTEEITSTVKCEAKIKERRRKIYSCESFCLLLAIVLFYCVSFGSCGDVEGVDSVTLILRSNNIGVVQSSPLRDMVTNEILGEIRAHIADDYLMIDISASSQDSFTHCVLTEDGHIRSNLIDHGKEVYRFENEGGKATDYFYAVSMVEVSNFCDELTSDSWDKTSGLYTVSGNVDFHCMTIGTNDIRTEMHQVQRKQKDGYQSFASLSQIQANEFVKSTIKMRASYIVGVDCGVSRRTVCEEVDLSACPWRDTPCVMDTLWDQRPLPYIPEDSLNGIPFVYNNRSILKHNVEYVAPDNAVGKPFTEDNHRALIFTQPKVGTGALWEAMHPVSDFLVRSHEVDILKQNALWVPFPRCSAKPENGHCTVVMAFRDPKTWLVSSYFEFESEKLCGTSPPNGHDAVQSYHDFLFDPESRAKVLQWWVIGKQLREIGIDNSTSFIRKVVENDGIQIKELQSLPNVPLWMKECNLVVLQTEMAEQGTEAERKIQSILPPFHFLRLEERVKRLDLCPDLQDAYDAITNADVPQGIMDAFFQESQDFLDVWELYHPSSKRTRRLLRATS